MRLLEVLREDVQEGAVFWNIWGALVIVACVVIVVARLALAFGA